MYEIRFFHRPKEYIDPRNLVAKVRGNNLYDNLDFFDEYKVVRERQWKQVLEISPKAFSSPAGVGSLYDTTNPTSPVYSPTDFKTYVALSRDYDTEKLIGRFSSHMRVSSVGGTLESIDGKVFAQRRPGKEKCTHVWDKIDSSIGGFCFTTDNYELKPYPALLSKLERELNVKEEDLESVRWTSLHSTGGPDFSGMFGFHVKCKIESEEIKQRKSTKDIQELFVIDKKELQDYILDNFPEDRGDLIGDGCAVLISSMPDGLFYDTVRKINDGSKEKIIYFGDLVGGVFVEREKSR